MKINNILEIPSREEIFENAARQFVCKNKKCEKIWGIRVYPPYQEARCPHCNAGIDGKIYPKKRETPKTIRVFEGENIELESLLRKIINENQKSVEDYKNGKKQVLGFLIGQTIKQTQADPAEIKQRLEKLLG